MLYIDHNLYWVYSSFSPLFHIVGCQGCALHGVLSPVPGCEQRGRGATRLWGDPGEGCGRMCSSPDQTNTDPAGALWEGKAGDWRDSLGAGNNHQEHFRSPNLTRTLQEHIRGILETEARQKLEIHLEQFSGALFIAGLPTSLRSYRSMFEGKPRDWSQTKAGNTVPQKELWLAGALDISGLPTSPRSCRSTYEW